MDAPVAVEKLSKGQKKRMKEKRRKEQLEAAESAENGILKRISIEDEFYNLIDVKHTGSVTIEAINATTEGLIEGCASLEEKEAVGAFKRCSNICPNSFST